MTDDLSWAQSSLESLASDCTEAVERDGKWEEEEEDQGGSDPSLLHEVCPGGCSLRGDCVEGKCVCHWGFSGEACGVRIFDPPKV